MKLAFSVITIASSSPTVRTVGDDEAIVITEKASFMVQ